MSYLGEAAISGDDSRFSELAIGQVVFQRRDFDPRLDTIVRSQMLRLRRKLEEYYSVENPSEKSRITFERNNYRPILISNEPRVASAPEARWHRLRFWTGAGLGATITLVLTGLFLVTPLGRRTLSSGGSAPAAGHPASDRRVWYNH